MRRNKTPALPPRGNPYNPSSASRREFIRSAGRAALGLTLASLMPAIGGPMLTRKAAAATPRAPFAVAHSDAEWKSLLTAEQYNVLRNHGTERPFTSPLLKEHRSGQFLCAGCALPLFDVSAKFESGTGWPSFWQPLPGAVETQQDSSLSMDRTEIHCHRCGGHLGHVFEDGPKPTGLRYCTNGAALTFKASKAKAA